MIDVEFECEDGVSLLRDFYNKFSRYNTKIGLYYRQSESNFCLLTTFDANQMSIEIDDVVGLVYNQFHHIANITIKYLSDILGSIFHTILDRRIERECKYHKKYKYDTLYLYFNENSYPSILESNSKYDIFEMYIHDIHIAPDELVLADNKEDKEAAMKINNEARNILNSTATILEEENNNKYKPKKVIFNGKATIVIWNDNTKTICKWNSSEESYDPEKGLAMCFVKKILGNKYGWWEEFIDYIKDSSKMNLDGYIIEKINDSITGKISEDFIPEENRIFTPCKPKEKETRSCNTCVDGYVHKPKDDSTKLCVSCQNYSQYREYKELGDEGLVESDDLLTIKKEDKDKDLFEVIIIEPDANGIAKIYENMDAEDDHNLSIRAKCINKDYTSEIIDCTPIKPYEGHNNTYRRMSDFTRSSQKYFDRVLLDHLDILKCKFDFQIYGEYNCSINTKRYSRDGKVVIKHPNVDCVYKLYILEPFDNDSDSKSRILELIKDKKDDLLLFTANEGNFLTIGQEGIVLFTDYMMSEGIWPIKSENESEDKDTLYHTFSINIGRNLSFLNKFKDDDKICAISTIVDKKGATKFDYKYRIRKIYDNNDPTLKEEEEN